MLIAGIFSAASSLAQWLGYSVLHCGCGVSAHFLSSSEIQSMGCCYAQGNGEDGIL